MDAPDILPALDRLEIVLLEYLKEALSLASLAIGRRDDSDLLLTALPLPPASSGEGPRQDTPRQAAIRPTGHTRGISCVERTTYDVSIWSKGN